MSRRTLEQALSRYFAALADDAARPNKGRNQGRKRKTFLTRVQGQQCAVLVTTKGVIFYQIGCIVLNQPAKYRRG